MTIQSLQLVITDWQVRRDLAIHAQSRSVFQYQLARLRNGDRPVVTHDADGGIGDGGKAVRFQAHGSQ